MSNRDQTQRQENELFSRENSISKNTANESSDNICVLCFKNSEIYSIGECDHPVCYECSTRMRVLCKQNECPICRQLLARVAFTYEKLPYRQLERKNRSVFYNKQYSINFYTENIQEAFLKLLEHQCPKCNHQPFRAFTNLKAHVRKVHDLHYCDLCTENLTIFSFERRCYTQTELGLHRVKGDADNKSHRGHPLCEYCDCRYLDRDELFRHLRRNHYYCHFCEADGCNEFYKDYQALAEHFKTEHFLCEEGKCASEQFTGAFRTEIDYKAHFANTHAKTLNKQQVKQTRAIKLDITLGPRPRSDPLDSGTANVRSRDVEESLEYPEFIPYVPPVLDAQSEHDFPSLAGTSSSSMSTLRNNSFQKYRHGTSGLARTKENFPALRGNENGNSSNSIRNAQQTPIASLIKRSANSNGATKTINRANSLLHEESSGSGKIKSNLIHDFPALPGSSKQQARKEQMHTSVSHAKNRPPSSSTQQKQQGASKKTSANKAEFPTLSSGSKKKHQMLLEEDMLPSNSGIENVSAKHRQLVDDYVAVANPSSFQKLQMVTEDDIVAKAKIEKGINGKHAPKLTSQDFPSLAIGGDSKKTSSPPAMTSWTKVEKKQRELENKKLKVAPAPIIPTNNKLKNSNKTTSQSNNNDSSNINLVSKKDKKQQKNQNGIEEKSVETVNKIKEKNNNKLTNIDLNKINGNGSDNFPRLCGPPPGFTSSMNSKSLTLGVKPPPGFQNSVSKPTNDLNLESSSAENYSIFGLHSYIQPPECPTRNKKLVAHFEKSLLDTEALIEFRLISQRFREGFYNAQSYYEHCQAALGDDFDSIFPELLTLLPDIGKQQDLYLVHLQRLKTLSAEQKQSFPKMDVCAICMQVLLSDDVENHSKIHSMKENFPTLQKK